MESERYARRCAQCDFAIGPVEQRDNNRGLHDHGVHVHVFRRYRYVNCCVQKGHVGRFDFVSYCRNNRAMVDILI